MLSVSTWAVPTPYSVLVDARGVVIASSSIKTRTHNDINDYIDELYTEITRLMEKNDAIGKVHGIGIGAPNANYFTGVIEDGVNLPWPTPIPLAQLVSEKFGIPVAITNDANAAAIGEMTYGVARGLKDFIMITLGTGVGSGIVINGQMVYGHDGFAGELGHVIVKRNNGRLCGCGRHRMPRDILLGNRRSPYGPRIPGIALRRLDPAQNADRGDHIQGCV